ncbi:MAG TPA: hypothetical protein DEO83_09535 [Lachnospiraceae bacterium]|nr:hypothetical protein [Lachnospiraceae bacterium]
MDKDLTKLITRGLVALYLIYLSVNLIKANDPEKDFLLTVIGVIFLLISVAFIIYAIRSYIVSRKLTKNPDKYTMLP